MNRKTLDIENNVSLKPMNSLAIDATAQQFVHLLSTDDVVAFCLQCQQDGIAPMVLGAGSNVVLAEQRYDTVCRVEIHGYLLEKHTDGWLLHINAGQDWSELVEQLIDQGVYGLENLAMIPGSAGAAPIQNIGAYGRELCDFLRTVTVVDITSGEVRQLTSAECAFAYRDSAFKHAFRDHFIIIAIELFLPLNAPVIVNYPSLAEELRKRGILQSASPRDVYAAVCAVRKRKIPDPAVTPNAGSFFQNPVVDIHTGAALRECYPDMPLYSQGDGRCKLAAGWLIEKLGFKSIQDGIVAVHPDHALVLVNRGGADGRAVLEFAHRIQQAVADRFGIELAIEPRVYSHNGR